MKKQKNLPMYDVNCLGQVYKNGKLMRGYHTNHNCIQVSISSKKQYVHRIVAEKYLDNKDEKKTINHRDGNRVNNHVMNLEWSTIQENLQHARDNKLWGKNIVDKRKLTDAEAEEIKMKYIPRRYSIKNLASEYNVDYKTIWNVINNKSYIKRKEEYIGM